jgi:hypothetical protein
MVVIVRLGTAATHSTALRLIVALADVVVLGLFACLTVLLVAAVQDGRQPGSAMTLFRSACRALWSLLLCGVVAGLAFVVLGSISSIVVVLALSAIASSALGGHFTGSGSGSGLIVGLVVLLVVPIAAIVAELLLFAIWSVLVPVAVLERPGGLRAFKRSRELVRGHGVQVLVLFFALALPIALGGAVINGAVDGASTVATIAAKILLATLIAPIPVLATTVLYFELLSPTRTPAPPTRACLDPTGVGPTLSPPLE